MIAIKVKKLTEHQKVTREETMKVSSHAELRLEFFWDIIATAKNKKEKQRAIQGLKNWQLSQAYRLTSFDNANINVAIKKAEREI